MTYYSRNVDSKLLEWKNDTSRKPLLARGARQVESTVGAYLANRSVIDNFDLYYWRNERKQECDYVLRKGQFLVAIEVKSSHIDDTAGYEKFKTLFSKS